MANPVKTLIIRLLGDSSRFEREMRRAEYRLRRFTVQASQSVAAIGATAFTAASAATAKSLEMAVRFEHDMSKVQTVMSSNLDAMDAYSDAVLDVARRSSHNLGDVSKAAYQILSASFPEEDLINTLELSSRAATAGFSTIEEAVDVVTSTVNAYGRANLNATEAFDILLKTQQKGKTTMSEMAWSLANVTPIASALGVSFQEVATGIAILTAAGTKTAPATAQLRTLFRDISFEHTKLGTAVTDAWGAKLSQLLREGTTIAEILERTRLKQDDDDAFLALFTNVEAMQAATRMVGPNYEKFMERLVDMTVHSVGEMDEAYADMVDNTLWQLLNLRNQLDTAFTDIGLGALPNLLEVLNERLVPVLDKFTSDEGLAKAVAWAEKLSLRVVQLVQFLLQLGDGLAFVNKNLKFLGGFIAAVGILALVKGVYTLGMAFVFLRGILQAHPLFLVMSALVALIAVVGHVQKEFGDVEALLVLMAGSATILTLALWAMVPAAAAALAPWLLIPAAIAAALAGMMMWRRQADGETDPSMPLELMPLSEIPLRDLNAELREIKAREEYIRQVEEDALRQGVDQFAMPAPVTAKMEELSKRRKQLEEFLETPGVEAEVAKDTLKSFNRANLLTSIGADPMWGGGVWQSSIGPALEDVLSALQFQSGEREKKSQKPSAYKRFIDWLNKQSEWWYDRQNLSWWMDQGKPSAIPPEIPKGIGGLGFDRTAFLQDQMTSTTKEWEVNWLEMNRIFTEIGEDANRKFYDLFGWLLPGGDMEKGVSGLRGFLSSMWNRVKSIWESVTGRVGTFFGNIFGAPEAVVPPEVETPPEPLLPPPLRDETKTLPVEAQVTVIPAEPKWKSWLIPWLEGTHTVLTAINGTLKVFGAGSHDTFWLTALTTAEKLSKELAIRLADLEPGKNAWLEAILVGSEIIPKDLQVWLEGLPYDETHEWLLDLLKGVEEITPKVVAKVRGEIETSWLEIALESAEGLLTSMITTVVPKAHAGNEWYYTAFKTMLRTKEWVSDLKMQTRLQDALGKDVDAGDWQYDLFESAKEFGKELALSLSTDKSSETDKRLAGIIEGTIELAETMPILFQKDPMTPEWISTALSAVEALGQIFNLEFGTIFSEENKWLSWLLNSIFVKKDDNVEQGVTIDIGGRTATGWDWVADLARGIANFITPTLELLIKTVLGSPLSSENIVALLDDDASQKTFDINAELGSRPKEMSWGRLVDLLATETTPTKKFILRISSITSAVLSFKGWMLGYLMDRWTNATKKFNLNVEHFNVLSTSGVTKAQVITLLSTATTKNKTINIITTLSGTITTGPNMQILATALGAITGVAINKTITITTTLAGSAVYISNLQSIVTQMNTIIGMSNAISKTITVTTTITGATSNFTEFVSFYSTMRLINAFGSTLGTVSKSITVTSTLTGAATDIPKLYLIRNYLEKINAVTKDINITIDVDTTLTDDATGITHIGLLTGYLERIDEVDTDINIDIDVDMDLQRDAVTRTALSNIKDYLANIDSVDTEIEIDIEVDSDIKGDVTTLLNLWNLQNYLNILNGLTNGIDIDVDVDFDVVRTPTWVSGFLSAVYGGSNRRRRQVDMDIDVSFGATRTWNQVTRAWEVSNPYLSTYRITKSEDNPDQGATGVTGIAGPAGPAGGITINIYNPYWTGREDMEQSMREMIRTMQREGTLPKPVYA